MAHELMQRIHELATERLNLYRAASRSPLSAPQSKRLETLNAQLPQLWDEYRRELAAGLRPTARAFLNVA
jgi:hypothetical protein